VRRLFCGLCALAVQLFGFCFLQLKIQSTKKAKDKVLHWSVGKRQKISGRRRQCRRLVQRRFCAMGQALAVLCALAFFTAGGTL
jgi:hypothetical protein